MSDPDSLQWWLVPKRIWPPEQTELVEEALRRAGCVLHEHLPNEEELLREKFPQVNAALELRHYRWMRFPAGWYWAFDASDDYTEMVLLGEGEDVRDENLVVRCERGFDRIAVQGWRGHQPPRMSYLNVGAAIANAALEGAPGRWDELSLDELDQAADELIKAIATGYIGAGDATIGGRAAALVAEVHHELRRRGER